MSKWNRWLKYSVLKEKLWRLPLCLLFLPMSASIIHICQTAASLTFHYGLKTCKYQKTVRTSGPDRDFWDIQLCVLRSSQISSFVFWGVHRFSVSLVCGHQLLNFPASVDSKASVEVHWIILILFFQKKNCLMNLVKFGSSCFILYLLCNGLYLYFFSGKIFFFGL